MELLQYNIDPITGKRKRGRPKKIHIPDEIQNKIDEVIELLSIKEENKTEKEYHLVVEEVKAHYRGTKDFKWDFSLKDYPIPDDYSNGNPIPFFDLNKSYEASGYRPINDKDGLDFNPDWFTEARLTKEKTGHYCQYVFNSRLYRQHWHTEYERCRNGMTVNGYTITGPHYFFLNYYQLEDARVKKAGGSRKRIFPRFDVYLYEFFHYFELCRLYRFNCCIVKSRGIGASEVFASLFDCLYSVYKNSVSILTAASDLYVNKTMSKITNGLTFLNDLTDLGFFKLRQINDSALTKLASYYKYINGQKVPLGSMSLIEGIVADDSRKIRGDRADLIMYEEAGSNPDLLSSVTKGEALITVGGNRIGVSIIVGTGGDKNKYADGLRHIYENPKSYGVLPFRHNYSSTGEYVITSYFIPAYKTVDKPEYVDSRGWCDPNKGRKYYEDIRDTRASDPLGLVKYCAEYCFTAEEAFSLEGTNKFNKVAIANQIAYIRIHQGLTSVDETGKEVPAVPPILNGELKFLYKNKSGGIRNDNIQGVQWMPGNQGSIHVIEKPLWELGDKKAIEINNLYVAGIDSIDIGAAQTSDYTQEPSKFCIIICKRAYGMKPPMPVAYYMDRPNQAEEAYLKALKLMIWYNCRCNIEATRLTMWNYSKNRGFAQYFMPRPRATYMDISKRHTTTIGTPATPTIIDHLTDLIAAYIDEFCDNIWFPDLLDLCNRYSDENKGKFDMVAAWGMALLADEELNGVAPKQVENTNEEWEDIGYYIDEYGRKRYGIIPKQINRITNVNWEQLVWVRTSDPRQLTGAYN